ncbi:MAG: biotin--[acetyl-CoA-carboxylase] ligase, partial [Planctomycetota bacterium]
MLQTDALDVDTIEAARAGHLLGSKVVLFKSTASTNDIAWQYASNTGNHGLCVLAESQSAGRGRRGRSWFGEAGQSILMSVLLLDQTIDAERLTLTTAVAVAEAIGESCELPARIKWPNDILIDDKKLAGILVEKKTHGQQQHYVVGIGVNCHQDEGAFNEHRLKIPATSLAIETGKEINRNTLTAAVLGSLE